MKLFGRLLNSLKRKSPRQLEIQSIVAVYKDNKAYHYKQELIDHSPPYHTNSVVMCRNWACGRLIGLGLTPSEIDALLESE